MHIPPQRSLQIYSDNLGLVTRVKKHLQKPLELRDYVAADIDVELQILYEIQELTKIGFFVTIAHVHGHQDKHTPVAKL